MKTFNWLILLIILILPELTLSQVVYTPPDDYVYEFLQRLSLKKIIEYHSEVKPIARIKIAELLKEASSKKDQLNPVEQKELDWLFEEYAYEIGKDTVKQRWFLYSYSDSLFSLKVSPFAGYGVSTVGKYSGHTRWWGGEMFSTYSDWFGGSFSFKDIGEFGNDVDKERNFSPLSALPYKFAPDGIEASDIRASISFSWKWGSVSLAKDYLEWGNGNFGQLILSEKSPPFTFIRLDLHPTNWLRFYFIHGWLNSLVYDSSSFSYNHEESIQPFLRKDYINKYIAANLLSISPFNWLDVSFGNSIIYSGKLRPEFFIPFLLL